MNWITSLQILDIEIFVSIWFDQMFSNLSPSVETQSCPGLNLANAITI